MPPTRPYPGVSFKNLHPTPTAGRRNRGIDVYRDGMKTKGNESRFVSCKMCGFSGCDLERDKLHEFTGYGAYPPNQTVTAGSTSVTVPARGIGCAMCGSENFA